MEICVKAVLVNSPLGTHNYDLVPDQAMLDKYLITKYAMLIVTISTTYNHYL